MKHVEARELYATLVRKNEQTRKKHNHSQLFDWEVETYDRIMKLLEEKGDDEAQAFVAHTLDYALTQSRCNMWAGR